MAARFRHIPSSTALRGAAWRRSSRSTGANNCVEAAALAAGPGAGLVAVRDSKRPEGPAVLFPPAAWRAFLEKVG
ncbi:hypothetical protein GCM10018793_52000 [Streptomyces sulfonofaciens]|uniref:DUF397 domain-containing protein n=1 Tax=Streptomyces sulfonofaciens TaxID=68272 RepID=A0A919GIS7_9ACTN|nr:DUF397 domain-containing protein [Streptomyces sulfonofaciens]GHH85146.1 hypothetical protein GCM10018793_52000 [Streptomyces sulfonofaciens]